MIQRRLCMKDGGKLEPKLKWVYASYKVKNIEKSDMIRQEQISEIYKEN